LMVMHLRLALERPPQQVDFLNPVLSWIYAFPDEITNKNLVRRGGLGLHEITPASTSSKKNEINEINERKKMGFFRLLSFLRWGAAFRDGKGLQHPFRNNAGQGSALKEMGISHRKVHDSVMRTPQAVPLDTP